MKVFVTGATGFVGSHLVPALVEDGHEPVCLVRSRERYSRCFGTEAPEAVLGDLRSRELLRSVLPRVDAVVHLAGRTRPGRGGLADFDVDNDQGTALLAELWEARGESSGPFVHISSLAAAGPSRPGEPRRDGDREAPVSAYGRSKLRSEERVRQRRMRWSILRPPALYGPGDRAWLPVWRSARRGFAALVGTGSQELSLLHVEDLVAAIRCALAGQLDGQTALVAPRGITSTRDLLQRMGATFGRTRVRSVPLPRAFVRAGLACTGAAARRLGRETFLNADKGVEALAPGWSCVATTLPERCGWAPQVTLDAGLAATSAWYTEHGWL